MILFPFSMVLLYREWKEGVGEARLLVWRTRITGTSSLPVSTAFPVAVPIEVNFEVTLERPVRSNFIRSMFQISDSVSFSIQ